MDDTPVGVELPVQLDENGSDAHYCPDCGAEIPETYRNGMVLDELVDRYRSPFQCPECGYRGEVIRHRISSSES